MPQLDPFIFFGACFSLFVLFSFIFFILSKYFLPLHDTFNRIPILYSYSTFRYLLHFRFVFFKFFFFLGWLLSQHARLLSLLVTSFILWLK